MTINEKLNNQGRFVIEVTDLTHAVITDSKTGKVYERKIQVHHNNESAHRKEGWEQYIDTTGIEGCTLKHWYTVPKKLHPTFNETTNQRELDKTIFPIVIHSDLTGRVKVSDMIVLV
jgi:hypothetical protein